MVPSPTSRSTTDQCLCPRCRTANRLDANFCVRCGTALLLGKMYRILSVIKEGGMGTVYRGMDQWGTPCALKELRDQFTDPKERESGIRRFLEEGRLLHSLRDHPAIPKVYRSFVDNGRYYLAMEFIQGEDLEDVLRQRGRFSEAQVLLWADQLCDVLQYLHDNALIYRDMKPSNVMVARDGRVKVIDFGIAQLLRPGHRGTMIGTPGYAPPEQYQGITNAQSDEYALAATLHHLLTGRDPREHAPFSFPPAHTLNNDVSRATSRTLQKALQMEMEDRFPTVQAFRQALPISEVVQPQTDAFEEAPPRRRGSPVPASAPRQSARSAATPTRPQRQPFRRRVRRALLATIIGAGLLSTAPEWAPAIGTAIANVIQSVTDPSSEERNVTPAETAQQPSVPPAQSSAAVGSVQPAPSATPLSSVAEASAPPTQAVPSQSPEPVIAPPSAEVSPSVAPSASDAPPASADASASVAASLSDAPAASAPQVIEFPDTTITVDVAADLPQAELEATIEAEFERLYLEEVRKTYPNAVLADDLDVRDPDPSREGEEFTFPEAPSGRLRIQAVVAAEIIPNP